MPALTANPLENPAAYDKITIAGQTHEGIVRVTGAQRIYSWDVKDGPGAQGSTLTYRGFKPSDSIGLRFEFWEAWQATDFSTRILPLLQYDASKSSPKPVTVFHPALQVQGITAVVVKQIGQITVEDDLRISWTIEVIEYRPAPKANATATPKAAAGTAPGAPTAAQPTAEDELDVMIRELSAEAKKPVPN